MLSHAFTKVGFRIVAFALVVLTFGGLGNAQPAPPSPEAVNGLISGIKAHAQMCHAVTPAQSDLYRDCASNKDALIKQQRALGLSDAAVQQKLNASAETRGVRFP